MMCDRIINRFLELDDFTVLPLTIRLHMFYCDKCRIEITAMQKALLSLRGHSPFTVPLNLSAFVMDSIYRDSFTYSRNVSSTKWISVGSLIFLSILGITFSDSFEWLRLHFQGSLEIPLSIVLGLAISIYSAIYIGTHMDETKEFMHHFLRKVG